MANLAIVTLRNGIKSLRSIDRNETYHPGLGPQGEAQVLHVDQCKVVEKARAQGSLVIWDVGLGAAANSLTAIESLKNETAQIEIHSFDIRTEPLEFAMAHAVELNYPLAYLDNLKELLLNGQTQVGPYIKWIFHKGDFSESLKDPLYFTKIPKPDAIFYDPYSSTGNPEMWSLEHFTRLREVLGPEKHFLWSNYTRSTAVRVSLLLAGFAVGVGVLIGEKAETTIAASHLEDIDQPLGLKWLNNRVIISHKAAPMRNNFFAVAPIGAEDLLALRALEQFSSEL